MASPKPVAFFCDARPLEEEGVAVWKASKIRSRSSGAISVPSSATEISQPSSTVSTETSIRPTAEAWWIADQGGCEESELVRREQTTLMRSDREHTIVHRRQARKEAEGARLEAGFGYMSGCGQGRFPEWGRGVDYLRPTRREPLAIFDQHFATLPELELDEKHRCGR